PLAVGRIAPLHEQREPDEVATEPGRDNGRPEIVARFGAPPGERLFLADARPLASKHVAPDVVRIPSQRRTGSSQPSGARPSCTRPSGPHPPRSSYEPVMEDRAAGHLRKDLGRRG